MVDPNDERVRAAMQKTRGAQSKHSNTEVAIGGLLIAVTVVFIIAGSCSGKPTTQSLAPVESGAVFEESYNRQYLHLIHQAVEIQRRVPGVTRILWADLSENPGDPQIYVVYDTTEAQTQKKYYSLSEIKRKYDRIEE